MELISYGKEHNEKLGLIKDADLTVNGKHKVLTINKDGEHVGFISFYFIEKDICYLEEIEIINSKRRLGYGTQALELLKKYLIKSTNVKEVNGRAILDAVEFWNYIFKLFNSNHYIIKNCINCRYCGNDCDCNVTKSTAQNHDICMYFQYDFALNLSPSYK